SLAHWLASQQRYAHEEADHLLSSSRTALRASDRVRLAVWPAPLDIFVYTLLIKGCLLDGWRGWYYALQRALAETLLSLEIIQRRLSVEDDTRISLNSDCAKAFEERKSTNVEGSGRTVTHCP